MKPKPLVVLKNFTVPVVAMGYSPFAKSVCATRAGSPTPDVEIRGKGRPGTLPVSGSAITRAKRLLSLIQMRRKVAPGPIILELLTALPEKFGRVIGFYPIG